MEVEATIVGLICIDVTATLASAWLLRAEMQNFGERLSVIETQHKHNHRAQEG